MLFDLRSPHRRRVIKVVYVFLALLIGGGLIFFGVGTGNNSGGLLSNVTKTQQDPALTETVAQAADSS